MNKFALPHKIQLFVFILGLLLIELPTSTVLFAGNSPAPNLPIQSNPVDSPHNDNLIIRNPDGSSTITKPDGTKITIGSDGTAYQTNPDGTKIMQKNDGSIQIVSPDGTTIVKNRDGSSVTTNPDGSKIIKNADGSIIRIQKDGTVIK